MFTKTAALCTLASLAGLAFAQPDGRMPPKNADPKDTNNPVLVGKSFLFRELPYQVDTSNGLRGPQDGYNRCNETTKGPDSKCQTLIANSVTDFCLFGPQKTDTIGNTEQNNVVFCSQDTHGARLMPPGTLQGVQYIRTPSYTQIVGYIDQEKINIPRDDEGGELDSGGADQRGNPIGAQVFSNSLSNNLNQLTQARMWHMYLGSGMFCLKMCHEDAPNASGHCRHTYDTIGCYPSNPADYDNIKGKFLSCLGDDGHPVTPDNTFIPKSSQCVEYTSAKIYPTAAGGAPAPAPTTTGAPGGTQTPAPGATQTPAPGAGGGGGAADSGASSTTKPGSGAPSVTPVPPKTNPTTTPPLMAPSPSASQPGSAVSLGASAGLAGVAALVLGALFA